MLISNQWPAAMYLSRDRSEFWLTCLCAVGLISASAMAKPVHAQQIVDVVNDDSGT
jgi:hypothetical protein